MVKFYFGLSYTPVFYCLYIYILKYIRIIPLLDPLFSTRTSDLILPGCLISGLPLNKTPSDAFVTFSNNNSGYLALLTNVLDSVHHSSTRPIIVYGIDVDLNIDTKKYSRLIKRRLSQKNCEKSIYFCKIYAIIHSKIDYGIYI